MKYQTQDLNSFNHACDDFESGKYILADVKISSILNIIYADEKLKNIVNSCMENFNFDKVFKYASSNEVKPVLTLPEDEKQIVAFVFSLLYKFKAGEIDFYEFMTKYFCSTDELSTKEFTDFSNAIIKPFQQAINSIYVRRHVLVNSDDYQSNYYNKIKDTIMHIIPTLDQQKIDLNDKEELLMLLNSLYFASEQNDKKLVFSLMIGLDYFTKAHKKLKYVYQSIEECFSVN